jgi:hypothetical protein
VVLLDWAGKAVLDKETGLVWERSPSPTNNFLWDSARFHCLGRTTGSHKGWRLPSIHELQSLIDPARTGPALPAGHPFVLPQPIVNVHWTATTNAGTNTQTWFVNVDNGSVDDYALKATGEGNAWCVRGGMNADVY